MSTTKKIKIFGINLSGELQSPQDTKLYEAKTFQRNCSHIISTAFHEISAFQNKVILKSSILKLKENVLELPGEVKKMCATNNVLWILLQDSSVFHYDLFNPTLERIDHVPESVIDFSCTRDWLFVVTKFNFIFKLSLDTSERIHEFPKHQRLKKIVSGNEHTLILTTNGDVFSFGCGFRGSLGHGDVNSLDSPKQIDALAGIKIVDIAAGTFHSVAVSSFGDAYTFGWNTDGQLGFPKVAQRTFDNLSNSFQQVFSTPQLVELDEEELIKEAYCGGKYSILRSEKNRLFGSGLNDNGQLGLGMVEGVGKFTEVPVKDLTDDTKIVCGYLSTFIIN